MIDKDLEVALLECEKSFGTGAVLYKDEPVKMERVSSGSIKLDRILGGGVPRGRIVEIFGPESSGKTTLCIHHMIEHQKSGGVVHFIDTEHSFDFEYAKFLGLRRLNDKGDVILLISQPDSGEEALEIANTMLKSGKISLCVVDSVAALIPKSELEGEMGEQKMGLHARLMSQAMRKINGVVKNTNSTLVFTNQLRLKIGVVYGNPEVTTGGNALKYYASLRIDIRASTKLTNSDNEIIGNIVKFKTVKNKTFPPFKTAETVLFFGEGYNQMQEIVDLAVEMDIIQKAGSWYSYDDTKLGQGNSKVLIMMEDNEGLYNEIKDKVLSQM